mmetsp:Transcript_150838/g.366368  ORF Transcript_150838/g.366368 Transcript_150838/m.366368 type:complete len:207 (-) Transcript_150838:3378-3998(-)
MPTACARKIDVMHLWAPRAQEMPAKLAILVRKDCAPREDVLGAVEVLQIWKHTSCLLGLHAHPLRNGHHDVLPGELGNEAAVHHVHFVSGQERLGPPVVDLATLDGSSQDEGVACPAMIRAGIAVWGKGAAKVRMHDQRHFVKRALCFQLVHEELQSVVDHLKTVGQGSGHALVVVEAAQLRKVDVALGLPRVSRGDQPGGLLELL